LAAVARGVVFTTTVVVAVLMQPNVFVTVRVYVPAIAVVALADTIGLCSEDVNPLGPLQL
jgi:hypothetical protein